MTIKQRIFELLFLLVGLCIGQWISSIIVTLPFEEHAQRVWFMFCGMVAYSVYKHMTQKNE